jgi:hypothetical protein
VSYSSIVQPQNNGVAEPHAAGTAFVDSYNEQRLPEQNGFLSPAARREAWYARKVAA